MNKDLITGFSIGVAATTLIVVFGIFLPCVNNSYQREGDLLQELVDCSQAKKEYEFRVREDLIRHQILMSELQVGREADDLAPVLQDSIDRSKKLIAEHKNKENQQHNQN